MSAPPTTPNFDDHTVHGFGREWATFEHPEDTDELRRTFEQYFAVFPWERLPHGAVGADVGVGTGRWARYVAPRVGHLHCVDASEEALGVARRNLGSLPNVSFVHSTIEQAPIPDGSLDFAYSLGVLHHVPDTEGALAACVRKLKPGAPMLLYLYYALDNRSAAFRAVWRASNVMRFGISRLPYPARLAVTEVLARTVYWPLARGAALGEKLGLDVSKVPLAPYRDKSLYVMRNDALDRFGTILEKRYTRVEMDAMMRAAGLENVRFHEGVPYWCAVGFRRA
ncbi:MAG: methyltransferase domain-containing protein [Myxococcota bacterium]|nr:methyltransferase domain-containing protein [Myxococcota bacterium]